MAVCVIDVMPLEFLPCTPGGVAPGSPGSEICEVTPMCARMTGITGPDTWTLPPGAESLNISVVCGPITITDCSGEVTVINECGVNLSWAAPSAGCEPGQLCPPFTVDVAVDAGVYINWLEPCV